MMELEPYEHLNYLIVLLTQAMFGLVTPALLAVAIDRTPNKIRLFFATADSDPQVREDIDEIVMDFDAFLDSTEPGFEVDITEGWPTKEWACAGARQVLRMKRK